MVSRRTGGSPQLVEAPGRIAARLLDPPAFQASPADLGRPDLARGVMPIVVGPVRRIPDCPRVWLGAPDHLGPDRSFDRRSCLIASKKGQARASPGQSGRFAAGLVTSGFAGSTSTQQTPPPM